MFILVLNSGSSSLKGSLLNPATGEQIESVRIERVGDQQSILHSSSHDGEAVNASNHRQALDTALPILLEALPDGASIDAVGHRVVHGGEELTRSVVINDDVLEKIEDAASLAPLHNPPNIAGIRAARELVPDVPQVAVFDTAFHRTLPRRAQHYALPYDLAAEHGIRRYGFHGVSHAFVSKQAAAFLEEDIRNLRLITCHLGNGCSIAAVEYGRSIETSMGLTPLEGLVMGTRVGDVDPGALLHLADAGDLSTEELSDILRHKSGLAGLSGVGNDMRDIERKAAEGDERCRLAIQVFAHRIRKYIGAYAAVMGGVDGIVFTAGIGQNSKLIRHRIAQRLDFLGARIDEDRNRDALVNHEFPVFDISSPNSRTRLLVIATNESLEIARETAKRTAESRLSSDQLSVPIAISARHVHLTQETVEQLFGKGYHLTTRNPLSQPGQFAANETVTLVGPKNSFEEVRILGPTRGHNQVEISRTDEFFLGIDAPVRRSGDVDNSPGCKLVGPKGTVTLEQGVICAWRHIHMTPEDADNFGVKDGDVVEVDVDTKDRDLIFGDVLIRVSPNYKLEMHIDTDEGNAAELPPRAEGALVDTDSTARIRHRSTQFDSVPKD